VSPSDNLSLRPIPKLTRALPSMRVCGGPSRSVTIGSHASHLVLTPACRNKASTIVQTTSFCVAAAPSSSDENGGSFEAEPFFRALQEKTADGLEALYGRFYTCAGPSLTDPNRSRQVDCQSRKLTCAPPPLYLTRRRTNRRSQLEVFSPPLLADRATPLAHLPSSSISVPFSVLPCRRRSLEPRGRCTLNPRLLSPLPLPEKSNCCSALSV